MRIRAHVYAAFALAAMLPATAFAGTAVTASISAPAGNVVAGSTVQINCWVEGSPSMGTPTNAVQIAVSVTGGTVNPTVLTGAVSATCSSGSGTCSVIQGTSAWVTLTTPGTYTATCTGTFQGTFGGPTYKSATASLTTVAGAALPPAISGVSGPAELAVGTSGVYQVVATDPNTPPQPLAYAWTATAGTVTPDSTNPALAAWQAPATPGTYKLDVTVSNGSTGSTAELAVNVVLATYQAALPLAIGAPRRIASNGLGGMYVVDGSLQTATSGTIAFVTARGEARGFVSLPEPALAVASGGGSLWATTTKGGVYRLDPATGQVLGKIALASGPFARPAGLAYDPSTMTLWVADQDADRVRVLTPDGATAAVITQVGGVALAKPIDVAVDASSGKAFVLLMRAPQPGATTPDGYLLHAFDLATQSYVGSYVSSGSAAGQVTTAGGIAIGAPGIYLSDTYQSVVQVVGETGAAVATIGAWGGAAGQLTNPTGLAVMANGDVAVANFSLGRIDRFGGGAPLPTCTAADPATGTVGPDTDCDGLPDAWELANGLDPNWAGDGLLDPDGDGLNNMQELLAGTNPNNADTDGDGFPDGVELASGFDPLNPNDHLTAVQPSGPAATPPGLVKLSAVATGPGACSFGWAQKVGPGVTMSGSDTATPSFVARVAGSYGFDAVATCGGVASVPVRATVVVNNVAPLPDAGGVVVAAPGSPFRLDALASSDANGDALSFTWDQTLGPPLVGSLTGATLAARPRGAGLYAFQVTVSDPGGAASTAEVPVLVAEGQPPTAIAAALPADAAAGSTVVLDATPSLVQAGASFTWQQVAGPAVALTGATAAVASFQPPAEGRYAFEVSAGTAQLRSPPARVEVFVAPAGGALPTVSAAVASSIVPVGVPLALEATPSPSSAAVAWRQLSGPAAGLTDADAAVATVVPFAPGFHVFEASVKDGATEGHPARVAFEARVGGAAIPQASVTTPPGDAWVGQLVFLDARASTGAAHFRWRQVLGPWVAFATQGSVATFRPLAVGLYRFELVVDDGVTRSAPAQVDVNVVSGGVQ